MKTSPNGQTSASHTGSPKVRTTILAKCCRHDSPFGPEGAVGVAAHDLLLEEMGDGVVVRMGGRDVAEGLRRRDTQGQSQDRESEPQATPNGIANARVSCPFQHPCAPLPVRTPHGPSLRWSPRVRWRLDGGTLPPCRASTTRVGRFWGCPNRRPSVARGRRRAGASGRWLRCSAQVGEGPSVVDVSAYTPATTGLSEEATMRLPSRPSAASGTTRPCVPGPLRPGWRSDRRPARSCWSRLRRAP